MHDNISHTVLSHIIIQLNMDHERTLKTIPYGLKEVAEEEEDIEEEDDIESSTPGNGTSEFPSSPATCYPPIPDQPKTPREPMEFLCRSWSISTSEISLALSSQKSKTNINKNPNLSQLVANTSPVPTPPPPPPPLLTGKLGSVVHSRKTGPIGKWFHHRELIGRVGRNSAVRKREKTRMENAHLHSAVSIASLATAIAAVTASCNQDSLSGSKMSSALASASELLASHCLELAELSGADHERIVSAVRSAVDVRGPGDLLTLTAAAATALRGEAALKARLPKEAKNSAAISPCERALPEENHDCTSELDCASTTTDELVMSAQEVEESNLNCTGELMQCTRNGVLRWKHVKVCINKKSQVVVEIKSKHVRGAFSIKSKGIVNDVCETVSDLQNEKGTENNADEQLCFGISTGKGLIKFKCKSKADKQTWVDSIRNLLQRVTSVEVINTSLETTNIGDNT